jgi:hypothetical protein
VFPEVFGIQKPVTPKPSEVVPVKVDLDRYTGRYDSWGQHRQFSVENEKLVARVYYGADSDKPVLTSELIPLGDNRFLPADPAMGGNRGWDVAFWGDDGAGRATHYLDGVFAMRRTG